MNHLAHRVTGRERFWDEDKFATIKHETHVFSDVATTASLFINRSYRPAIPNRGCVVWGDHQGVHHNPKHWQYPYDFIPERWLVPEGDPLYPPKYAWRPFEHGPRNCIGQQLALTEIKIILVLTVRELLISDAYREWDTLKEIQGGWSFNGDRAYMVRRRGGHPCDSYPCSVSFVDEDKKKF
ncbi:hypothetical protein MMC29_006160 [Sticta canariensis]|nr:hypothetical protein [Sticta canariensis]